MDPGKLSPAAGQCKLVAEETDQGYSLQGLANSFPSVLSFLYASALTFALSGIFNQCGCSLRYDSDLLYPCACDGGTADATRLLQQASLGCI